MLARLVLGFLCFMKVVCSLYPDTRRITEILFFSLAVILICVGNLTAQPAQGITNGAWPEPQVKFSRIEDTAISSGRRMIRFGGRTLDSVGAPVTGVVGVSFAIYAEQSGGSPLWQETQNVASDDSGRFSTLLGAASPTGIPLEMFSSGESLWLAVLTHSPGVSEQLRVLLVSVPYALRALDSDTLGGKPASAFMLANSQCRNQGSCTGSGTPTAEAAASLIERRAPVQRNTVSGAGGGFLPLFTNAIGDLSNSVVAQSGANVGIGTTHPASLFNAVSGVSDFRFNTGAQALTPSIVIISTTGKAGALSAGTNGASFEFDNSGFFAIQAETHTNFLNNNLGQGPLLLTVLGKNGHVGIGTSAPDQMLTVVGSVHSTTGGFIFPDGSVMSTAATGTGLQPNGSLVLGAGAVTGAVGNIVLKTAGNASNTMSDRLLIAGTPKAMTGAVPTANLFSMHILAGDAAGGRVKFTIVASDGVNYAMETGELIYLASPKQMSCAMMSSKYSNAPPTYTNTALAIPAIGQVGSLNAQCNTTTFSGDQGVQIWDTAPTTFTPTTHKVYYTIENQSQTVITLQP